MIPVTMIKMVGGGAGGGSTPPPEPLFSPLDLSPFIWFNTNDYTAGPKRTKSGNGSEFLNSFITDDVNAKTFTRSGSSNYPCMSGPYVCNNEAHQYIDTVRTDYKFLTDASTDWELWCDFTIEKPNPGTPNYNFKIFHNTNTPSNFTTTSNAGLFIAALNGVSGTVHELRVQMTRNSAGNVFFGVLQSNVFTVGTRNKLRLQFTKGTSPWGTGQEAKLTCWINGVQIFMQNRQSNTLTAVNPSFDTAIGVGYGNMIATWRHFFIIKRTLTSDEVNKMTSFLDASYRAPGNGAMGYSFWLGGQSNAVGQGSSGAALTPGMLGAQNMWRLVTPIQKAQFGVNQASANLSTIGPETSFAYYAGLNKPNEVFLYKNAVQGTSLCGSGSTAWNINTGTLGINAVAGFIAKLELVKYAWDRTVKIKGMPWRQGEADSTVGNTQNANGYNAVRDQYKNQLADLYEYFINQLVAAGYDTSECRLIASLMNYSGDSDRPWNDAINEAIIDVCTNILIIKPGLAGKTLTGEYFSMTGESMSDGTHFTSGAQVSQGQKFWNKTGL